MKSWLWMGTLAMVAACADVSALDEVPPIDDPAITSGVATPSGPEPEFEPGNPTCVSLGISTFSYKNDPPASGTFALGNGSVTITIDGLLVDWTSTIGVDAVIVKGGPNSNVYYYDPEATSGTGLHAPYNDGSGTWYGLSHLEFCFDYEVDVSKTAYPKLKRTWAWTIDKTGDQSSLLLAAGQSFVVNYSVAVARAATDSDWEIEGAITVSNPAPIDATITDVADTFASLTVPVTCPVTFPYTLAPGATLTCTYDFALSAAIDGTNAVSVSTAGPVGPGSATAAVDFDCVTLSDEVDECIDVTDDRYGALGTTCVDKTYTYALTVGPYAVCGSTDPFINTASLVTNDTGATDDDSWTVDVTIAPCDEGCTLTPGYWKTHSLYGPAPYDDAWLALGVNGADTAFFSSGKTYYQVLWTPPRGNVYYILAHAYVAAELNRLNGASSPVDVDGAMAFALAYFQTKHPGDPVTKLYRFQLAGAAALLDDYNNGFTGPGHCSE